MVGGSGHADCTGVGPKFRRYALEKYANAYVIDNLDGLSELGSLICNRHDLLEWCAYSYLPKEAPDAGWINDYNRGGWFSVHESTRCFVQESSRFLSSGHGNCVCIIRPFGQERGWEDHGSILGFGNGHELYYFCSVADEKLLEAMHEEAIELRVTSGMFLSGVSLPSQQRFPIDTALLQQLCTHVHTVFGAAYDDEAFIYLEREAY